MKIDKLIQRLKEIREEHGNLEAGLYRERITGWQLIKSASVHESYVLEPKEKTSKKDIVCIR